MLLTNNLMKLMMSNIFLMLLAAFTSCVSKSSPITQQQIPLKVLDGYQNNTPLSDVSYLIDDNPNTEFQQGIRINYPYEVTFDLADYNATVTRFEFYDGNGNDFNTKFILVNEQGQEVEAFTFTGSDYNTLKSVDIPPTKAKKLIIRAFQNGGYPKYFRMFGTYTQAAAVPEKPKKPLKDMLGVNAHWWNFLSNTSTPITEDKYQAFLALNLTSLRNYGNANEYQPVKGQWAFNPVRQGWFEDDLFARLKKDRPDMVRWSVMQGQYDYIRDSWKVADSSIWLKGVVQSYEDHGGWGSLSVNFFTGAGSGEHRVWHISSVRGEAGSNTYFTVPTSFPKTQGFAASGGAGLVPSDTVLFLKGQQSNLNLYWNDNNKRTQAAAWQTMGEMAFVTASRKGTNKNAPDYTVYKHGAWWRAEDSMIKGGNLADVFEGMNEPNAWWGGYDDCLSGPELAMALSMMYDGHKGLYPNSGVKNADPNFKMSTSGLATDRVDLLHEIIDWSRTNRGYKDGQVDLPFDIIQFHCYPSADGQYSSAKGGLPPEMGMIQKVKTFVDFSNRYARGKEVWIGEWGYDVNPESPQNAPAFGKYSAEQTRAMWAVRAIIGFAAAGIDRAQWFRLYQDNNANNDDATQFATMSLLHDDPTTKLITRKLVGEYFRQVSEYGNYVYDTTLVNSNNVRVLRFKDGAKEMLALWTVESMTTDPVSKRPSFTENKSSYTFNVPNGYMLVVNQFAKDKILKQNISSNKYTLNFGSAPVLVEVVKK